MTSTCKFGLVGLFVGMTAACGGQAPQLQNHSPATVAASSAQENSKKSPSPSTAPVASPASDAPVDTMVSDSGVQGQPIETVQTRPKTIDSRDRMFMARWKAPRKTLDTLFGFTTLPRKMSSKALDGFRREFLAGDVRRHTSKAFADAISLDKPLELAVVADTSRKRRMPKPMMGYSVGLRSFSKAKAAVTARLTPMGDGVWLIGDEDEYGTRCALAKAKRPRIGPRLVCSERLRTLKKVAWYLAHKLPTERSPNVDMYAELTMRSLLDRFGSKLAQQAKGLSALSREGHVGNRKFDKGVTNSAKVLGDEVGKMIKDADRVVMTANFRSSGDLAVNFGADFAGQRSWLVQTLVDGAEKRSTAPEMFWRLPSDSAFLSYARAGDPARFNGILMTVRTLAEGALEKAQVFSARDRADLASLIRMTNTAYDPVVSASGGTTRSNPFGWVLTGSASKGSKSRAWLTDLVRIYNRATVQSQLRRLLAKDPELKKVKLPTVRRVPSSPALGRGALTVKLELTLPKKLIAEMKREMEGFPVPPSGKLSAYIVHAPDKAGSWMAAGMDQRKLVKLITNAKRGKMSIESMASLSSFKTEKHNSGGAFMLRGLIDRIQNEIAQNTTKDPKKVAFVTKLLKQLPNGGKSPILVFGDAKRGAKPGAKMQMVVQKGTLEDIGWFLSRMALKFGKAKRP